MHRRRKRALIGGALVVCRLGGTAMAYKPGAVSAGRSLTGRVVARWMKRHG